MSERKTVSASKGLFHKDFPFVIPSIYRKVIDEYLVELNLLSNQSNFKIDGLFAYGLFKSFDVFTNGYEPASHKVKILSSICGACDMEYSLLERYSNAILTISQKKSINDVIDELDKDPSNSVEGILLKDIFSKNNYYSRLHSIGVYELTKLKKGTETDSEETNKLMIKLLTRLGFCEVRANKDINLYKNNIKRIQEAMDLIKQTVEESKRKK